MNDKNIRFLESIGFIFGILGGIICLLISLGCVSSNSAQYVTQQSVQYLEGIYYVILALIFFKVASWSDKRTKIVKEEE
ncbi:MAG: hypothetical protein LBV42_04490 [Methanobrevibacter sp.]|jgi:hypothetical protein|nr:hypothetical protein [Methanobrevibacter sp.]